MPNITFLEVDKEDQKLVNDRFPEAKIVEGELNGDDLIEECKDAEVISPFIYSKLTKEVIEKLPNLKLIATRSVGYNHIDLETCKGKGITVCNVPDYGSHVIAEHVFAIFLSAVRHVAEADDRVEAGEFDYHGLRGMALKGKIIGIVGTGKIGSKVAQIANGFGMKILAFDHHKNEELSAIGVSYVTMDDIFERSDVITLHVPATEETTHMVNAKSLSAMKDGVVIINTARGEIIDTKALVDALKSGKVGHALLDVLEHEKNFEENKELIGMPNVVTTPHIAFYADDSMRNMYLDCFESMDEFSKGEVPEHAV